MNINLTLVSAEGIQISVLSQAFSVVCHVKYYSESMRLVKFFPYNNYFLEGLTKGTLYFNNVYNFNDPFEGLFRYKVSSNYEDFKSFYLKYFNEIPDKLDYYFKNISEFENKINERLRWRYENNAVCCFSDYSKLTDILMWANYADKNTGLCIVFESDSLKFSKDYEYEWGQTYSIESSPTGPHKIHYTNRYLNTDPLSGELTHQSFLTTKFSKWQNEKEFRYISPKQGNYLFVKESVIAIIFGLRTSQTAQRTVTKITQSLYNNIKFKRATLMTNKFGIKIMKA